MSQDAQTAQTPLTGSDILDEQAAPERPDPQGSGAPSRGLQLLRGLTHRTHLPIGVYNLRPVTSGSIPGRGVYRSSLLWGATGADRRRLAELGLGLVVDLRTQKVHDNFPDPELPGVRNVLVDLHGTGDAVTGVRVTEADTIEAMKARYRRMVTDPGQRRRIGEVLHLVADEPRAVLFHCTDGKDRTGWVALLLQHLAGDPMAQIRADYLASQPEVQRMADLRYRTAWLRGGRRLARRNRPSNIVSLGFLDAALEQVASSYGSLDAYLRDGLGVDDELVERLRAKL